MIPLPFVVVAALLVAGAFYLIGRNASIRAYRTNFSGLRTHVGDLEQQVDAMNASLTKDPQRAGIDMGKRYAVNQIQTTLDHLLEELPR